MSSFLAYIHWQAASAAVCVCSPLMSVQPQANVQVYDRTDTALTPKPWPAVLPCSISPQPYWSTSSWTLRRVTLRRSTAIACGEGGPHFPHWGPSLLKIYTVTAMVFSPVKWGWSKGTALTRGFGWGDNTVPLCRKWFYCFTAWGLRCPECSAVMDLLEHRACAKSQIKIQIYSES